MLKLLRGFSNFRRVCPICSREDNSFFILVRVIKKDDIQPSPKINITQKPNFIKTLKTLLAKHYFLPLQGKVKLPRELFF